MKKNIFDANQILLISKETGEFIETKENEVIEVKSARDSSQGNFSRHDFTSSKFCSLNTEILSLILSINPLKWTELGFLLRILMFECASNYCILIDPEGKPFTTKSIAKEFNLNESTVSSYLKKLFKSKILLKSKDLRPNVKPLQVLYINPYFYKNTSLIHREVRRMFMGSYKEKSKHLIASSNIFENFFETDSINNPGN
jgi:predicted transcriptional regulator